MTIGRAADAVVVGGGVIGAGCALALADRGLRVLVVSERRAGTASLAAAGLLAPSIDAADGPAQRFALASRDSYPDYLARLEERTGIAVALDRSGVLQVALGIRGVRGLRRAMPAGASWLDPAELARLEPALAHAAGAVLLPHDGWIDNVALHGALDAAMEHEPRIDVLRDAASSLRLGADAGEVRTAGGETVATGTIIIAAGAWGCRLPGLPRPLPVEPVRGQVLAYDVDPVPLRHAAFGPTGYLVPRAGGRLLVGSTVERVGFDAGVTDAGAARLRATAAALLPDLRHRAPAAHWAGLRPMTPDGQPLLGRDPEHPALLYACGHSRNGILMTPLTGECVASLVLRESPALDLSAFAPDRFDEATRA